MRSATHRLLVRLCHLKDSILLLFSTSFFFFSFTAYASLVSPPGASATVQGLVAGMDDGLGFTIGSLIGGFLYQSVGGSKSFKIYALVALLTCFANIFRRNPKNLNNSAVAAAENETEKSPEEAKLNRETEKVAADI